MVIDTGKLLPGVTFEDLTRALDSDANFRAAVSRHLGLSATRTVGAPGNHVSIETKANFALDDHKVFDLNGDGLKLTVIAEN